MFSSPPTLLVVGAGMFGLTAAGELARRGWSVTVIDPGPIPRDTAASTDISKVVRMDYGRDELFTALGEASRVGWHLWNQRWGESLYHEDGFLVMSRQPLASGGFEADTLAFLTARGHPLERIDALQLARRFPKWAAAIYPEGYLNPHAGWAESGRVVTRLVREVRELGVRVIENQGFANFLETGSRVTGVRTLAGAEFRADCVVLAAGAWTPSLLPELSGVMWATGQPVLNFRVADAREWQAPRFPVWAADIGRTGWYGFPALEDGTLKVANHGPGWRVHPDDPRVVPASEEARFRAFLRDTFPALADAPLIGTRLCLYCDTFDGNFWLDHHPQRPGLFVAAGDSGHAFKFAPVMGELIADAVERKSNHSRGRFAWRERTATAKEGARAQ